MLSNEDKEIEKKDTVIEKRKIIIQALKKDVVDL